MTIDYVKCRTQDLEIPDENLKREKDGLDKQAKEKVAQLTKEVVAKYESFTEREENVGNMSETNVGNIVGNSTYH